MFPVCSSMNACSLAKHFLLFWHQFFNIFISLDQQNGVLTMHEMQNVHLMCISCSFFWGELNQSLTENNKLINQGVLQSWDACKGQSSDSYCVALCFHAVTLHGKCSFLLCYLDCDWHLCVKEPAVHFYLRPVKLFTGDVDVDQLSALIFGPQFPKRSFLCQTHVFFSPSFQQ